MPKPCIYCSGSGRQTCTGCGGTGRVTHLHSAYQWVSCGRCIQGRASCSSCGGRGYK